MRNSRANTFQALVWSGKFFSVELIVIRLGSSFFSEPFWLILCASLCWLLLRKCGSNKKKSQILWDPRIVPRISNTKADEMIITIIIQADHSRAIRKAMATVVVPPPAASTDPRSVPQLQPPTVHRWSNEWRVIQIHFRQQKSIPKSKFL